MNVTYVRLVDFFSNGSSALVRSRQGGIMRDKPVPLPKWQEDMLRVTLEFFVKRSDERFNRLFGQFISREMTAGEMKEFDDEETRLNFWANFAVKNYNIQV